MCLAKRKWQALFTKIYEIVGVLLARDKFQTSFDSFSIQVCSLTNQNPPVTCDWSIGLVMLGNSGSKLDWSFSALSNAYILASSEAYTRFSRSLL